MWWLPVSVWFASLMVIPRSIHIAANGITSFLFVCLFIFFIFYFIFKLYNIVLVLPYIEMNPPQAYTCSPSWTLLPPPSPYHPSESSQCTSPKHPVSCIEPGLVTRFIYGIIHISMPSSLPMHRVGVWSLVGELRSHMLLSAPPQKKSILGKGQ